MSITAVPTDRTDVCEDPKSPLFIIEPGRHALALDLAELWRYRDLLYFLTRRDIAVRYKQTVLGLLWAVLQPFLSMVVFTVFLGTLAGVPSDGIPYPVFSYLGLLPWTYFASALARSSGSLVASANLLTKVYFPRIILPLSGVLSALVDFAVAFVVLIFIMAWYGIPFGWSVLALVPLVALTALAALGAGLGLAALNVRYRDVQHAVPFFIQIWMYATPVVYPASLVPEKWRLVFALNPMTGIIESYRAATLGRPVDWQALAVAAGVIVLLSILGVWQFRRVERTFADVV